LKWANTDFLFRGEKMGQKEVGFKLRIGGDISDILTSLKELQTAFGKVEMPDGIGKRLTKDIEQAL
jgi:hypothetical protein